MKEENKDLINTTNLSTKYGFFAGLGMVLILLGFQLAGDDFHPGLKLWSLLPVAVGLSILFRQVKLNGGSIFPTGVSIGLKMSAITALTVTLGNLVLFLVNRDIAFSKYAILPETSENFLVISAILLFEIFVFGGLISFILMQSMKSKGIE